MTETVMPCFDENQYPEEGLIIGRLLTGYGELELEMCSAIGAAIHMDYGLIGVGRGTIGLPRDMDRSPRHPDYFSIRMELFLTRPDLFATDPDEFLINRTVFRPDPINFQSAPTVF